MNSYYVLSIYIHIKTLGHNISNLYFKCYFRSIYVEVWYAWENFKEVLTLEYDLEDENILFMRQGREFPGKEIISEKWVREKGVLGNGKYFKMTKVSREAGGGRRD